MLRARMEKLKIALTQDNPTRRVAELDRADVQRLKDQLPSLLKRCVRVAKAQTSRPTISCSIEC